MEKYSVLNMGRYDIMHIFLKPLLIKSNEQHNFVIATLNHFKEHVEICV